MLAQIFATGYYKNLFRKLSIPVVNNSTFFIVGAFFNDRVLGHAHKHKIPVIQIYSFGGMKWMDEWFGNSCPCAYVPNTFLEFRDE
jgi:hypothetical protein